MRKFSVAASHSGIDRTCYRPRTRLLCRHAPHDSRDKPSRRTTGVVPRTCLHYSCNATPWTRNSVATRRGPNGHRCQDHLSMVHAELTIHLERSSHEAASRALFWAAGLYREYSLAAAKRDDPVADERSVTCVYSAPAFAMVRWHKYSIGSRPAWS